MRADSAAIGAESASPADASACHIRLFAPSGGSPSFVIPAGGRAVERYLAGGLTLCRLLRADGSRFAEVEIDQLGELLDVRFYRSSARLRFVSDAAYPAKTTAGSANVGCSNAASASIGSRYWRRSINWRLGRSPTNIPRYKVVHALRNAQSEWVNNINWCGVPDRANGWSQYKGTTSRGLAHDGTNTVDWGSLNDNQDCMGALACAYNWYDNNGNPVESDVRFNSAEPWSLTARRGSFDIQSLAAHEFGHVRQFDHVGSGRPALVMWPYFGPGNISGRKLGKGDARANNAHY